MKIFGQLASHPKFLIGSKLSLDYQEIKFLFRGSKKFCVGVYNRGYPTPIIVTYTKPNLVPQKGILFPAKLGFVLTQLTTWNDWRAVQKFSWGYIGPLSKILAVINLLLLIEFCKLGMYMHVKL